MNIGKFLYAKTPLSSTKTKILLGKPPAGILHLAGILLLFFYVMAGVIYSFSVSPEPRFRDESDYLVLSDNLLHGPGYSWDGVNLTAGRPPGYPFFLAAIRAVGGGIIGFRLAQYGLLAATILLLNRLCSPKDRFASLIIVIGLVALYPVLFYTSAICYPQTLAAFLFILILVQLTTSDRGTLLNLICGLTFGVLVLVMPTFAFTLLVVLATAWALKMIRWQEGLLIFAAACLIIGLWTARNAMVFHRFVPIATNSGENLLIGNSEATSPYGGTANINITHYHLEAASLGLDEVDEDRYYEKAALHWVEQNPSQAIVLYCEKVLNFFNIWNEYSPKNKDEFSPWKQIVMAVSYIMLLTLLAWRLLDIKRYPLTLAEKLFLIVYVLTAFTTAIFVTRIRYRLPYDCMIIAIIAMHLNNRIQSRLNVSSK